MMKVAGTLVNIETDRMLWDINCAISIWQAVFNQNFSLDQNDHVISIMITAAKKMTSPDQPLEKHDWHYARRIRQAAAELKSRLIK